MTKSGRLQLGDNFFSGKYRSTFNHCDVASKAIEFGEKNANVIEVGIDRKPICDFLLVINPSMSNGGG